jgi:hypothetical protein
LFYIYLADVSVPLLGTGFVEGPGLAAANPLHPLLAVSLFRVHQEIEDLKRKPTCRGSRAIGEISMRDRDERGGTSRNPSEPAGLAMPVGPHCRQDAIAAGPN